MYVFSLQYFELFVMLTWGGLGEDLDLLNRSFFFPSENVIAENIINCTELALSLKKTKKQLIAYLVFAECFQ